MYTMQHTSQVLGAVLHLSRTFFYLPLKLALHVPYLLNSSVDGHLGCFYVPAVVNSVAVNIGVHISL